MSNFVNTWEVIGDDALIDSIITRTVTEYADENVTYVGGYVFYKCQNLTSVNLPSVTKLGNSAFSDSSLVTADFSSLLAIESNSFYNTNSFTALIIRTNSVCSCSSTVGFGNSGAIKKGTGYIYVPQALIEDYKVASVWSTYAAQFRALEDYTVDGTTTGALDPTKI